MSDEPNTLRLASEAASDFLSVGEPGTAAEFLRSYFTSALHREPNYYTESIRPLFETLALHYINQRRAQSLTKATTAPPVATNNRGAGEAACVGSNPCRLDSSEVSDVVN